MNYAIRLLHVRDGDSGDRAVFVGQRNLAHVVLGLQDAASDGLDIVAATVVLDHLLNSSRHGVCSDDVTRQYFDKLVFIFRLQEGIDRACRKGGECLIGWRENREWTLALKRFDETSGFYSGNPASCDPWS